MDSTDKTPIGYIYKITSPDGKVYIGQTRNAVEIRWKQHERSARTGKFSSPLFHRAIAKFGWDNFTREVVVTGPLHMLDAYETAFILMYKSFGPRGYNLTFGGDGACCVVISEAGRQTKSDKLRKYVEFQLPMYVAHYKRSNTEGFRLVRPGWPPKIICESDKTMEEKYNMVMDLYMMTRDEYDQHCKERKDALGAKNKIKPDNGLVLPKYVTYFNNARGEGFIVRYPNTVPRKFSNRAWTLQERYDAALANLATHDK